jgi:rhomboid protease GluP
MNSEHPNSSQIEGPAANQTVPVQLPAHPAYVTYILLGLTILVYLAQVATSKLLGVDVPQILGLKVNSLIVQGQVWRLFTPMFLHGSLLHIGFNMYALYLFGPGLERFYGHGRFLALYVISGFGGNVFSFAMSPAASLGSSTAIFGLLGAEGVFLYQNRKIFGKQTQKALQQVIMLAVINLAIGMSPGIDNWGHLGGLLGGVCFAWLAGPVLRLEGVYPAYTLVDTRSARDAWLAALGIGGSFAALVIVLIRLRSG